MQEPSASNRYSADAGGGADEPRVFHYDDPDDAPERILSDLHECKSTLVEAMRPLHSMYLNAIQAYARYGAMWANLPHHLLMQRNYLTAAMYANAAVAHSSAVPSSVAAAAAAAAAANHLSAHHNSSDNHHHHHHHPHHHHQHPHTQHHPLHHPSPPGSAWSTGSSSNAWSSSSAASSVSAASPLSSLSSTCTSSMCSTYPPSLASLSLTSGASTTPHSPHSHQHSPHNHHLHHDRLARSSHEEDPTLDLNSRTSSNCNTPPQLVQPQSHQSINGTATNHRHQPTQPHRPHQSQHQHQHQQSRHQESSRHDSHERYHNNNQQLQRQDNNNQQQYQHIKKPLNPFMIYMQKMRKEIMAHDDIKESAAINRILGQRWQKLSKEEQQPYYELARQEKILHSQRYPGWSARDNYANQKKKKKLKLKSLDGLDQSDRKCRARFGLHNQSAWCKPCKRKKKCIMCKPKTNSNTNVVGVGAGVNAMANVVGTVGGQQTTKIDVVA